MIINVSYFNKDQFLEEVEYPDPNKIPWTDRSFYAFHERREVKIDNDQVLKNHCDIYYYLCDDDIFLKIKFGDEDMEPHDCYLSLNSIVEQERCKAEFSIKTTPDAWVYLKRELFLHQLK